MALCHLVAHLVGGGSPGRLTEIGLLWQVEHGVHWTGESDGSTWRSSARTPDLGDGSTVPAAAGQSGMVARLLSFCAPPCLAASGARTAPRTRWQASGATLPAADASHGRRQNPSAMDGMW